MYSLGTGEVDILEKIIPASFVGRKLVEFAVPGEISVIAISRAGRTFIPLPETIFEDGDTVHLAVLDSASNTLIKFFK
jgi:trk system potassium uptake protein TrkA